MTKRIKVKSSSSPLGGGSVRVYVGDTLVWTKRIKDLSTLLKAETEVKSNIASYGLNWAKARKLRLV